jgi:hypothetical protein
MAVMEVLRNRHVVIALLVTPVLAVGAWFAVGYWVAGDALTPQPAAAGASYPLVERSGCRYAGGVCVLANGDLELEVSLPAGSALLSVTASVPLNGVWVGIGESDPKPPIVGVDSGQGMHWQVSLGSTPVADDLLRVVVERDESRFFGETSLRFQQPVD